MDIKDKIKTFDDICKIAGINPELLFKQTSELEYLQDTINGIIAFEKLLIINQVLNQGWRPDWNNRTQYKWYPYFDLSSGGFSFVDAYCRYGRTYAGVGSRLCYKTKNDAEFAGKLFIDIYRTFMVYDNLKRNIIFEKLK